MSELSLTSKKQKVEHEVVGEHGTAPPPNHSDGIHLGLELIGQVARFACTSGKGKDNDLQNICVAVRRKNVDVIRHTYLFKNYGYLQRTCVSATFLEDEPSKDAAKKVRENVLAWMQVNSNWKKLCSIEQFQKWQEPVEEDDLITSAHYIIFNNPIVAIFLDLVDVLKCLVTQFALDVNGLYAF